MPAYTPNGERAKHDSRPQCAQGCGGDAILGAGDRTVMRNAKRNVGGGGGAQTHESTLNKAAKANKTSH